MNASQLLGLTGFYARMAINSDTTHALAFNTARLSEVSAENFRKEARRSKGHIGVMWDSLSDDGDTVDIVYLTSKNRSLLERKGRFLAEKYGAQPVPLSSQFQLWNLLCDMRDEENFRRVVLVLGKRLAGMPEEARQNFIRLFLNPEKPAG